MRSTLYALITSNELKPIFIADYLIINFQSFSDY